MLDRSVPAKITKLPIAPDRLAVLLYTSDSTATPKGVGHNHRTLLHLVMRGSNGYRVISTDRIALLRTLTVIGGTLHTLGALLNGAPPILRRLDLCAWGHVPVGVDHEEQGAEGDRHVGDIENACAQRANTNV
ncbi:MAG: hypothetical protein HW419_2408 [Deltaproteobacteria bacterium]|nr:hypothetical protein [Deltaproteobacteria bacterium]